MKEPSTTQIKIEEIPISPAANDNPNHMRPLQAPLRGSVGSMLLDRGRLSIIELELILKLQKERGIRFGEAAVKLGILSEEDVREALSKEIAYPYLPANDTSLGKELVAAYRPFDPAIESLRALRSQLQLRWFSSGEARHALAVVSPGAKEGRSFIAANLAIVCSQMGDRTLLIDADMRHPRQHALFKVPNEVGLRDLLSDRADNDACVKIPSLVDFSLLTIGQAIGNPLDLLKRSKFLQLLDAYGKHFDVIIIDTPAGGDYSDARIIAPHAGAALLVARNHRTSLSKAAEFAKGLQDRGTLVVGSFLNEG